MSVDSKAKTVVKTNHSLSEKFEVKVDVHQGSILSAFLFVIVMEALTREIREGLPRKILYGDDLMLVVESMESLKKKVLAWKEQLKNKEKRLNVKKTKVMLTEKTVKIQARVGNSRV